MKFSELLTYFSLVSHPLVHVLDRQSLRNSGTVKQKLSLGDEKHALVLRLSADDPVLLSWWSTNETLGGEKHEFVLLLMTNESDRREACG